MRNLATSLPFVVEYQIHAYTLRLVVTRVTNQLCRDSKLTINPKFLYQGMIYASQSYNKRLSADGPHVAATKRLVSVASYPNSQRQPLHLWLCTTGLLQTRWQTKVQPLSCITQLDSKMAGSRSCPWDCIIRYCNELLLCHRSKKSIYRILII